MLMLSPHQLEDPSRCGYLPDRQRRCRYFLAEGVTGKELDVLLASGWRKFGAYFFQPSCPDCRACTPLRVKVADFTPSRSQKRTLRLNHAARVEFLPLRYHRRVYEIYTSHSRSRFAGSVCSLETFLMSFYCPPCPALQVEIRVKNDLVAVGWLDVGANSLSSVYFCFDPEYAHLSPGTFSALCEIDYAKTRKLAWYYLGYTVTGNRATAYKKRYQPNESFDWLTNRWLNPDD